MHTQARFFIRTALVYLVAAFSLGGLYLLNQGLAISPRIGALLYPYYHLLMVGWATQLICGVAVWMFPPLTRERPRGDERVTWFAYGALNLGLLLRVAGEPLQAWYGGWGWMLAVSAVLQTLAIWAFVIAIWPRVKGKPIFKTKAKSSEE
jgi:hypothetical protein